jgi:hypothetical protein
VSAWLRQHAMQCTYLLHVGGELDVRSCQVWMVELVGARLEIVLLGRKFCALGCEFLFFLSPV